MEEEMKKIYILLCFIVIFSILVGCVDDKEKLVTAPSDEYVIESLQKVPGILEIKAITEDTDPMENLNKPGWYIGHVYFSYSLVNQSDVYGDNLLDKGTDAGGSIEIYKTKSDANKRNEYLSSFDGSILSSGSHTVIGTIIVRTSNELTISQQKLLETNIIASLTGNADAIVNPFGNSNNNTQNNNGNSDSNNTNDNEDNVELDYEYLIDFPARTVNNACSENVSHLVYYPSLDAQAIYSNVDIKKFSYTFDDSSNQYLTINFNLECYIWDMYEGTNNFVFEIVAYNRYGTRIKTKQIYGEGDIDETVRVQTSLILDIDDVKNGIKIEFDDFEE